MTIDDDLLSELAEAPFARTVRPPAEIAARARTLRRRRDLLRVAAAAALVAGVTTAAFALSPAEKPPVTPARGTAPIDVPCPQPGGPKVPLARAQDLLWLPPGIQVSAMEARTQVRSCLLIFMDTEGATVSGRLLAIAPPAVPTYRGTGDVPGRHETHGFSGLRVDVWRIDLPVPQYRAYWTTKDGLTFGVHAENMDRDLQLLAKQVGESTIPSSQRMFYEPAAEFAPYLRTTLAVPGVGPVELLTTRFYNPLPPPPGARRVQIPGNQRGFWWEAGGVGHLSWVTFTVDGSTRARGLSGRGLTMERAVQLAGSLRQVPVADPRLPPS